MATIYRTSSGDILDTLAYRHYGHLNGVVEAIYQANPGLSAQPQPFASGLEIIFPVIDNPSCDAIQLWS
jgi:phage tail protein X